MFFEDFLNYCGTLKPHKTQEKHARPTVIYSLSTIMASGRDGMFRIGGLIVWRREAK